MSQGSSPLREWVAVALLLAVFPPALVVAGRGVLASPDPPQTQAAEPTPRAYLEELRAIRDGLERTPFDIEELRAAARALPDLVRDREEVYRLDHSWLEERLGEAAVADSAEIEGRARLLTALGRQIEELELQLRPEEPPAPALEPDGARSRLAGILDRRAFRARETEKGPEWLRSLLGRIFDATPPWAFESAPYVFLGLAVVVLALLVMVFVRGSSPGARRVREDLLPSTPAPEPETRTRSRDLLARSEELLGRGRLREAVRLRFQAFLALLEEKGLLKRMPGSTNREILRLLPSSGPAELAPAAAGLVNAFERHWYGERPPSAEEASAFRSSFERAAAAIEGRGDS
jgi:hypothetical protein